MIELQPERRKNEAALGARFKPSKGLLQPVGRMIDTPALQNHYNSAVI